MDLPTLLSLLFFPLSLRQATRRWELLAFRGLMTQSSTNYDKKNFGMTTKSLSRDASLWCGWIKWEARCQEPQQTQKANGSWADFPEKNRQMSLKQGYYFHIKETITTLLFVTESVLFKICIQLITKIKWNKKFHEQKWQSGLSLGRKALFPGVCFMDGCSRTVFISALGPDVQANFKQPTQRMESGM